MLWNQIISAVLATVLLFTPVSFAGVSSGPAPPIPALTNARTLAIFGDSFTAFADSASGINVSAQINSSYGTWLNLYTGYRVMRVPNTNNFGVQSDTCVNMQTRVASVIAAKPDVVVILCGTNDVTGSYTCAQITAALDTIYSEFLNSGIAVIRGTIIPRSGGNAFNTTQAQVAQCVNQHDRRYAEVSSDPTYGSHHGWYLADFDPVMTDPTQATWSILSGYLNSDGLHPSERGGSVMGWTLAQVINQYVPQPLTLNFAQADEFNSTYNTSGNLLPNPLMTGTSGVVSTPCTGTSATGVTVSAPAGITCTVSLITLPDGRPAEQIAVSAGSCTGSPFVSLQQSSSVKSSVNPGDILEGQVELNVAAGSAGFAGADVALVLTDNGTNSYGYGIAADASSAFPSTGWATGAANYLLVRTPRHTVQGTLTNLWVEIDLLPMTNCNGGALSATVSVTGMAIHKVIEP